MRRDIFFFPAHPQASASGYFQVNKAIESGRKAVNFQHPSNVVRPGETEQCDRCKRRVNLLLGTFFNGREFICIKCRASELTVPLADIAGLTQVQFTEWLRERKKR